MIIRNLLNTIVLSTATLTAQAPQQVSGQAVSPQAQRNSSTSQRLLNSAEITRAICELNSPRFQIRNQATNRLRQYTQALITCGQFDQLAIFIKKLQIEQRNNSNSLEVYRRIAELLNQSSLVAHLDRIPQNRQEDYVRFLVRAGILSQDIISEDSRTRRNFLENQVTDMLNSGVHPAVLTFLSMDPNEHVREIIARHPNTPPATLAILAGDRNSIVQCNVADNRNTPPAALITLAKNPNWAVRLLVSHNSSAPSAALTILAGDRFNGIRMRVANNLNTLPADLSILATDPDPNVRDDAQANLTLRWKNYLREENTLNGRSNKSK